MPELVRHSQIAIYRKRVLGAGQILGSFIITLCRSFLHFLPIKRLSNLSTSSLPLSISSITCWCFLPPLLTKNFHISTACHIRHFEKHVYSCHQNAHALSISPCNGESARSPWIAQFLLSSASSLDHLGFVIWLTYSLDETRQRRCDSKSKFVYSFSSILPTVRAKLSSARCTRCI